MRVATATGILPRMESRLAEIRRVCLETLQRGARDAYTGYSKFDALESPVVRALSFRWWPLRLLWTQVVTRSPLHLRGALRVSPGINPEAPALFARANLDCLAIDPDAAFAERTRQCLDWLVDHDSSLYGNYHGRCWGYHHAWQSPGFYQLPHFPNCYITTIVVGALLHGYRALGTARYLEVARSAADFILRDLRVFHENDEEKCIGYVPDIDMPFVVINVNALAATMLAEIAQQTGETELATQARKLMTFVVRQQTPAGAWHYTVDPRHSLVAHDNYHTGMILDALIAYERASGDDRFRKAYVSGLEFYRTQLFLADGAPKWTSADVLPHDVHGSGQGALSFALAGDLETAERIATWGIEHFYKGDGAFAYQQGRFVNKRFTLFHWCNGWMVRGLAALLHAAHR